MATVSKLPNLTGSSTLATGLPSDAGGLSDYVLFLPLRNAVVDGAVGVTADAYIEGAQAFGAAAGRKPIVWYGTSILQGGAVSRSADTYSNILSRDLDQTVLNFGFAGNGRMEMAVLDVLADINAELFVVDCNPNLDADAIAQRTVPLVQAYRKRHPAVPVLLVSGTTYGDAWFVERVAKSQASKRAALAAAHRELVAAGDRNVHLIDGATLFGDWPKQFVEPTVGGTHPSSLGHRAMADAWKAVLSEFPPCGAVFDGAEELR